MRFATPLIRGHLLRRYKRFLADIDLGGQTVQAHCPNPGAMLGLNQPGMPVWIEPNDDPRKKLNYGWRLSELPGGHLCGIDTSVPNKVVAEALKMRAVEGLDYDDFRAEVPYGTGSRVDFLLTGGPRDIYLEVKNAHLRRDEDWAEFPDCVTARGRKHLEELSAMVRAGHRAVMLFLVQRTDCTRFRLAADLDPAYAKACAAAQAQGVELFCYGTRISRDGVWIGGPLPLDPALRSG